MSEQMKSIVTPIGRLCFVHLFEPYKAEGSERELYSAVLVFPKSTDISALKKSVADAVRAKWPEGCKGGRNPINDGDLKADDWGEVFKDSWYIRVSSQNRPAVVDRNVQDIIDPSQVWSGQYGRATVRPYAYDKSGNKGVSFGFTAIQIARDGERLSGGGAADKKMFDTLPDKPAAASGAASEDDVF